MILLRPLSRVKRLTRMSRADTAPVAGMERVITAIETHPRGKGRVSVYINDRFAFVLYKGELSKYDLEAGMVMTDDLYERIMTETVYVRAKKRGMNLLRNMDRTESDVRMKLSEGGYPPDAVDAAIDYLRSYRYIDDMRYASEYIRFRSASMSRKQIEMKLAGKGVARDTIEAAFEQYEAENGTDTGETEKKLIQKLINKRYPNGVGDISYEDRQKLFSYLYGKGFSFSVIEEVYGSLLKTYLT